MPLGIQQWTKFLREEELKKKKAWKRGWDGNCSFKEVREVSIKKVTFEQRYGKIQKQAMWISRRVFWVKTQRQEYARHILAIARRPVWLN